MAFVDAPVSGTRQPAEQGKLTAFASGPAELAERCRPVFDTVAAGAGLDLRVGPAVHALLEAAGERHAEDDMAAIVEALRS